MSGVNPELTNGDLSLPTPTLVAPVGSPQQTPRPMSGVNSEQTDGDLTFTVSTGDVDAGKNFYPDFGASESCRIDGNPPGWITKNMMKFSKFECCSYYFPLSLEKCSASDPFYPNFQARSCSNDGKHPEWMGGAYLVETMAQCCNNFFRGDSDCE
jgi:hypothetical protein